MRRLRSPYVWSSDDPRAGHLAQVASAPDTMAVSSDNAWTALSQLYEQLGIKLSVVDRENHVIGVLRGVQRRSIAGHQLSRLLECGSGSYGPNADRDTVTLTLLSYVTAENDKTAIDTRVGGEASQNGISGTVACASSGVLEDRVAELLRKALGVRGALSAGMSRYIPAEHAH